jgi:hypothetical protein
VGLGRSQLSHVAQEAKAVLQTDSLDAIADRGYFSGEEISACQNAGITAWRCSFNRSEASTKALEAVPKAFGHLEKLLSLPSRTTLRER